MATPRKPKRYLVGSDFDNYDIIDATTPEEALQSYFDNSGLTEDDLNWRTFEVGEYLGEFSGTTSKIEWSKIN